jgi:hypothetical protein
MQGMDYLMPNDDIKETIPVIPSTLETVDVGIFNWLNDILNLHVTTNNGWKKVPVVWLSAERAFQIKNNKDMRDSSGHLRLPIITIMRNSVTKDPTFRGSHYANIYETNDYKGGATPIARRIQQVKTRNFANAQAYKDNKDGSQTRKFDNKKVVYETLEVPVPTYLSMLYTISIRTEHLQQTNTLVMPFMSYTGGINSFVFENDGHKYEAFIDQNFDPSNNTKSLGEEERFFLTEVKIKALGYIMGGGQNRERPDIIVRENIVDVKISRERVILDETIPWKPSPDKYRG